MFTHLFFLKKKIQVLHIANLDERYVLQAVHELFDVSASGTWPEDEERINRLVFIGRKLDRDTIRASFIKHAIEGKPLPDDEEDEDEAEEIEE